MTRLRAIHCPLLLALLTLGLVAPACSKHSPGGNENDGSVNSDANDPGCEDLDGDGYGPGCALGPDCDPLNGAIHPGADEECGDGKDNDCNGLVDEGCTCESGTLRLCSSVGDPLALTPEMRCRPGRQACEGGVWASVCLGEITPVQETCNGTDDNCDGQVDEGLLNPVGLCSGGVPPEDCGPTGEGNGLDDDGDGQVDEDCSCAVPGYDPNLPRTGQPCYSGPIYTLGVGVCHGGTRDCQANATWGPCTGEVLPSAEVCGDGLDNDCDGHVDEGCPGCAQPSPEVCDGVDNNCDGVVDEGVRNVCGGCGPVATDEVCGDGLDNNCNGQIDEGCPGCAENQACYPGPPDTAGIGACLWGTRSCSGEFWSPCTGYVLPSPELCGPSGAGNGVDEDCDGIVDNGCVCQEGATRFCGSGAGACTYGIQTCHANAWGPCTGGVGPQPEVCDGLDNDCNGLVDDGLLNACGLCDESCYLLPMDPTSQGTPDEGIDVIDANDPENPTGLDGITLTKASFIPPYLWSANHDFDTVTKFNTTTHAEEGTFWVGDNPSRTAVDLDGNMWVGGRNDGRLTKVLWDVNSCDPMNNGVAGLQTSTGGAGTRVNAAGTPFADDCVVYSAVPEPSRPSIRGVAAGPDGRLWIGYTNGGVQAIDPHTLVLGTFHAGLSGVPRYEPDGNGVQQPTGTTEAANAVYGMVLDAQGFLYISPYSDRTSFSVFDTTTETWVGRYHGLCGSYGIALDAQGRVWFGSYTGCSGVNMFDPAEQKLYAFTVPTSVSTTANIHGLTSGVALLSGDCKAQQIGSAAFQVTGLGVEPATGDVWASHWQLGYTMRLHVDELNYANSSITFIGTVLDTGTGALLPGVPNKDLRGVGFDMLGFAWTLGLNSGRVWKLDPATNARAASMPDGMTIGEGSHYTYSDFTGSTALNFTSPRGFWRYIFVSEFEEAQVDSISWDAYVPAQTTAGIRIRALDAAQNPTTGWFPPEMGGAPQYFDYPAGGQPNAVVDLAANGGPLIGWAFEVDIRLTTQDRDIRPIVHDVRLSWQRP